MAKYRYTVDLNEDQDRRLQELQKSLGAASKAEVIQRALAFLSSVEQNANNPAVTELLTQLLGGPVQEK